LLKAAPKLWLWIRMGENLQLAFGLWTYHLIIKINNKKKITMHIFGLIMIFGQK